MSMNLVIHAAIRRDLARFLNALEKFQDGDRQRAEQLATAWANFDAQLTHHHEGEHEIAWPALEAVGVSPSVLAEMDAEHELMADALASARSTISRLTTGASRSDADAAATAMESLREVTTNHLDHEDSVLEPVYLAKVDTPEIKEMGRKFGKQSPTRSGRFFAWVSDGATPEEKTALRSSVPAPVLMIIGGIFGRSYRRDIAPVWQHQNH